MAYIDKLTVRDMRQTIRKLFPTKDGWKWSVTIMDGNIGVSIALVEYPKGYKFPPNLILDYHNPGKTCDEYGIDGHNKIVMVKIGEVLMKDWYDKSNSPIDYHHIAYFPSLRVGTWNKAAVKSSK